MRLISADAAEIGQKMIKYGSRTEPKCRLFEAHADFSENRPLFRPSLDKISEDQRAHWKKLANKHSGTVQAVGSESLVHKHLRYEKLAELFPNNKSFSVHEIGPGIGDFYAWMKSSRQEFQNCSYSASEITPEYCVIARERFPDIAFHNRDILGGDIVEKYDYVVLSGVFHQQGEVGHSDWIHYMQSLLLASWSLAHCGMAFNVLTHYADFYKPGNFYTDLTELQSFIARRLSRFFRLDCDYPLFEATAYVRKPNTILERYPTQELRKYVKDV